MAADKGRRRGRGAIETVTSIHNPAVKEIRALALRKYREASGLFLAEGLKLVQDAIEEGWSPRTLMMASGLAAQTRAGEAAAAVLRAGGRVIEAPESLIARLTQRDNPQTVIGVFAQRYAAPDAVRPHADALWVVLETIRDPGNLGTIIRTADAVGASGVVLLGPTCDPFSIEAVRATMGSIFHVPVTRLDAARFLRLARTWPGPVVGTHLSATTDYRAVAYSGPVLLVMGSERAGLPAELAAACDPLVKIPMAGRADSLNLAVATAVMLYEIRRPRLALR